MTVLVWRGKCLPMPPGKGSVPGVTCSPEAKPAPFGAAGKTVDQYRTFATAERAAIVPEPMVTIVSTLKKNTSATLPGLAIV